MALGLLTIYGGKMLDLQSYLHTSKMSGSLFQTALGYCVAIHPAKSSMNRMWPPQPSLVFTA